MHTQPIDGRPLGVGFRAPPLCPRFDPPLVRDGQGRSNGRQNGCERQPMWGLGSQRGRHRQDCQHKYWGDHPSGARAKPVWHPSYFYLTWRCWMLFAFPGRAEPTNVGISVIASAARMRLLTVRVMATVPFVVAGEQAALVF